MSMFKTARFYIHWNGSLVKISLQDGESVGFDCGGETEEGYHSTSVEMKRDGSVVHMERTTHSRDCDGPMSHYYDGSFEIDCIPKGEQTVRWTRDGESQRDHYAESMNY